MQCHRCPKSVTNGGTPDEECLTCVGAEYLDNDHKTVIPVGDAEEIDRHPHSRGCPTGSGERVLTGMSKRNEEDCRDVVETMKHVHPTSIPHIMRVLMVLVALGGNFGMMQGYLQGQTLTQYAKDEGVSRQSVFQRWNRMVAKNANLTNVRRKRNDRDE